MAAGDVSAALTRPLAQSCNNFDGVDDYVQIPHHASQLGANLNKGFTISAWVNAESLGLTSGRIIDKSSGNDGNNGFKFHIGTAGFENVLYFRLNNGTTKQSAPNSFLYHVWTHCLVTISSTQLINFYISGLLNGSANQNLVQPVSAITTVNPLIIGNNSDATATFDGSIKDVKMWNRVLSAAEITKDAAGLNPETAIPNLIHWFKLGGDYKDYGFVGVTATNSGSVSTATDDQVSVVLKATRVTANDKYLACEINGKILSAVIEEAP